MECRQARLIRPVTHCVVDLGCQDYLVATSPTLCEPAANDLLGDAFAFLRAVNVCRVEEVDLLLKGAIHDVEAIGLAGFRPEIHGTKAQQHPQSLPTHAASSSAPRSHP